MTKFASALMLNEALDNTRGIALRESLVRLWYQDMQPVNGIANYRLFKEFLQEYNSEVYEECMVYLYLSGIMEM